ncbi:MAG: hypothetical protein WBC44_20020 [Planctomycetaceae bacterium]
MTAVAVPSQSEFYREFLMARGSFQPSDFGVDMEKSAFIDALVEDFHGIYRDTWSVDELCLHPREAMAFCDGVRRQRGWFDVPDDIILRSIMQRRKNP